MKQHSQTEDGCSQTVDRDNQAMDQQAARIRRAALLPSWMVPTNAGAGLMAFLIILFLLPSPDPDTDLATLSGHGMPIAGVLCVLDMDTKVRLDRGACHAYWLPRVPTLGSQDSRPADSHSWRGCWSNHPRARPQIGCQTLPHREHNPRARTFSSRPVGGHCDRVPSIPEHPPVKSLAGHRCG
jgi:hypothetical protein